MNRDEARAIETGERALVIAAELGDTNLETTARYHLAQSYFTVGDYVRAREFFAWIVDTLESKPDVQVVGFGVIRFRLPVHARGWLTMTLAMLGEFNEGISHGRTGLRLAEQDQYPFNLVQAGSTLGVLYLARGDVHSAIALLERMLALHRAHGIVDWLSSTAAGLGSAYALAGRVAEAFPLLEEAVAVEVTTMGGPMSPRIRQLGAACLSAGRIEEALERARNGLEPARGHGQRGDGPPAPHALAEAAARRDPAAPGTAREVGRAAP